MIRRRVVIGLLGLAPFLTACPAPPGMAYVPAPAAAPSWADEMLAAVNAQRAAAGAPALVACGTLNVAAATHSDDQAAHLTMTHTGSDGSTLGVRADRAGYDGWTMLAENVAAGYATVDSVMNDWMSSSGHRANLLNPSYAHVGFGRAAGSDGALYWTQDFGRSGTC